MWSTGCRDMTLGVLYVLSLSRLSSELHQPPERCLPLPSDFRSLLLLRLLCLWWPWWWWWWWCELSRCESLLVPFILEEPSRECDFVKSFCTEWTKWRIRPGLSLRCSVVVVVVEVRWYCSVWKPSRCNGICFSNWSRRFAGIRFILPLPPCEDEPPSSRDSLQPGVLPLLSREALP